MADAPHGSARVLARWTLVLVSLTILWRLLRFVLNFPIWGDEAFVAVSIQTRDMLGLMKPLEHFQIVPVGYLWLAKAATMMLGDSAAAMRLPSLVVGVASVLLLWRLAGRLLDQQAAFLAMAVFAASYYPMRHAVEVKSYSMDLFSAVLVISVAWTLWTRPRWWPGWVFLTIASSLMAWCAYPSVFVSGAMLAALTPIVIRERSARVVAMWLGSGLVLIASFLVVYVLVAKGQEAAGAGLYRTGSIWKDAFPPVSEPWRLPWWFIQTHTGNMMAYPAGGDDFGSSLTCILVVIGAVSVWRTRRSVAILLLAPFAVALFAAVIQKYPYGESARVMQYVAPMICLLTGAGLAAFGRRIGRIGFVLRAVPIVMLIVIVGGMVMDVRKPYKEPDDRIMRDAMHDLRDRVAPDDHVIVAGTFDADAVALNLNRFGGRCARMRHFVLQANYDSLMWAPSVDDLPSAGTVWLIVYRQAIPEATNPQIDAYVDTVVDRLGDPERSSIMIDSTRPWIVSLDILSFDLDAD